MLFSLANMAAHTHCLLRFASLLRRLAAGSSPAGSGRGGRPGGGLDSAALMKRTSPGGDDSAMVTDGSSSLSRPGSPQRAVFSQPAGARGGGSGAASRLGVSSAEAAGGGADICAGGGGSHSSWPSLRQLKAAYPFYPLWLVSALPCVFLCVGRRSP